MGWLNENSESLLGGAFSLANSALTNAMNRKTMQMQNEFNANQAKINRDWQEYMYNQYSTPSAMVEQYKQAGLNPALVDMAGGQTFSGATALGTSPIPSVGTGLESILPIAMSVVDLKDKLKNSEKEREKKSQEIASMIVSDELKQYDMDLKTVQMEKYYEETRGIRIDNKQKGTRLELQKQETDAYVKYLMKQNEVSDKQIEKMDQEIQGLISTKQLTDKQKAYYVALATLTENKNKTVSMEQFAIDYSNKFLSLTGAYPNKYEVRFMKEQLGFMAGIFKGDIGVEVPVNNVPEKTIKDIDKLNIDYDN